LHCFGAKNVGGVTKLWKDFVSAAYGKFELTVAEMYYNAFMYIFLTRKYQLKCLGVLAFVSHMPVQV